MLLESLSSGSKEGSTTNVFVRVTSSGSKEGSVLNVLLDSHLVVIRRG